MYALWRGPDPAVAGAGVWRAGFPGALPSNLTNARVIEPLLTFHPLEFVFVLDLKTEFIIL